ncbi:hypothetical protein PHISCL_10244, partial [Aspergillus sclerotialis]
MFVFRREDLPPDPVFPADLEQLGYFINDKDQIRQISAPDQEFKFKINRNYRWNEVQRGAMNECVRKIVLSRLHDLGLTTLHLPIDAGPKDPNVPILASRNLSSAARIVVVFGEPVQDLGIWAHRTIGSDGINAGSAVAFAQALVKTTHTTSSNPNPPAEANGSDQNSQENSKKETALILANTGQLVWHCGTGKAITHSTFLALPRASAVDLPANMSDRNKIPKNANWQEHVECVFEDILSSRGKLVRADAEIDVIGLAEGGLGAVQYLAENWRSWSPHITAIVLTNPLHYSHLHLTGSDLADPRSFAAFVASRCRAYVLSEEPLGTPVQGFRDHGCNCYSGGEALNIECLMPKVWGSMLQWLERVHSETGFGE